MRKLYKTAKIGSIQQGTIINSCVATRYVECSVHGLIITPRCDIENGKVSIIHYLPLVNITDWYKRDFWEIFSAQIKKNCLSAAQAVLQNNNQSKELLKYFSSESLIPRLSNCIKEKDLQKLICHLKDIALCESEHYRLTSDQVTDLLMRYSKISLSIFKELKENKRKEYYLLEDWKNSDNYYVVLLREVRSLDFELAQKVSKGFFYNDLIEDEINRNDIRCDVSNDGFINPVAILDSPHIEHLIQMFFLNFGRIGVENHSTNLEEKIHNKLLKLAQ